ncbi:MAG: SDR family oxidoreductase [Myxococcota bacterium]
MHGKVCIVTGANTGIGLATAKALAGMGAHVVLACRDRAKGEAAAAGVGELMLLDLASLRSVRAFAEDFRARFDRLDVLVNNAGLLAPARTVTEDGHELTFQVNHLGPFLLTSLLLPMLRASAPSRIVNVSSRAHVGRKPALDDVEGERRWSSWDAYGRSKLYNILFTRELARRLDGTGVSANACHPGLVASSFQRNVPAILRGPWELLGLSPESGARTQIWLATSPEVEGKSGGYYWRRAPSWVSGHGRDDAAATALWELSEGMVAA